MEALERYGSYGRCFGRGGGLVYDFVWYKLLIPGLFYTFPTCEHYPIIILHFQYISYLQKLVMDGFVSLFDN